ncbi:hypothetical protein Tco_0883382 [Tanacetum coccineum]
MVFSNMARQSTKFLGKVTPLFDSMLVQNQAPESEGSSTPPEPQPTPFTSQLNFFEPQTKPLQTETPPPVFHEPQFEAHIEEILQSPTTYQRERKTQKRKRTNKDTKLPQTSVPQDLGADEAVHKVGVTVAVPGAKTPWGGAPAQTRSKRVLEMPNEPPLSEGHTSRSGEGSMEYHFELTDNVPPTPHDSPLSGGNTPGSDEGRMELIKKLMETCTLLTKRVLALEEAKTAQDRVINRLKLRVKRLEKKRKTRTSQPMKKRLFKGRVETSTDTSLGEDASKQGRSSDKPKPITARPEVTAAAPSTPPTTAIVFDDEDVTMAMAQTLIKIKEVKAEEKGVEFRNVEEASRPVRSITTLQPLPKIDPKDKAHRLHEEELAELDRAQKERQRQEEATNAVLAEEFDEIQARIDVDALFVAKLQQEERECGYKHGQLKGKTYEEIHELYERQQKRNQDFILMDSEKEAQKSGKRLKRVAGSYATQKSPKKPKVMKSVKNVIKEEAAYEVNYEPLSRRFPIVNWEYKVLGNVDAKDMYVYKLTRADGSSSYHGDMQAFLRRLDRQDLNDLYMLVQERFQDHPHEGHDLLLWGDLRMLFDPDEKMNYG